MSNTSQGGLSLGSSFSIQFSLSEVSASLCFVAREEELTEIHSLLNVKGSRRTVVLHGLGGMGKTQVTIAYAKRHKDHYSAIFWLNCKDEDSLKQSFLRAAQRIAKQHPSAAAKLVAAKDDQPIEEIVDAVSGWFDQKANSHWLLIYDNYDTPKLPEVEDASAIDLKRFMPKADHGAILITTRSSQVALGHRIEMKKLADIKDSLQILAQLSGRRNVIEGEACLLPLTANSTDMVKTMMRNG